MTDNIALQLYTLRNYGTLDERLKAAAEAGYDGVETVGTHDLSPADLKARLEQHGLTVCSSHHAPNDLLNDLDPLLRFNEALGNQVLVFPYLAREDRPQSAEGWRALGQRLGGVAGRVRDAGMELLYHNHDFEMTRFEGERALDLLLEAAGDALGVELDLAWVVRGGDDPEALLPRYTGRVRRLHVKDLSPKGGNTEEGGWADVGYGVLDWLTLLSAAQRAGAEWFIVEHDEPKDPVRTITRSLEYLRGLELGSGADERAEGR